MHQRPEPVIENGALICLHFSLALSSGEIIDSNYSGQAASFRLGDGSMLPGFEALLIGLKMGEEIEHLLQAEQAFGPVNPDNRHRIGIAKFKHLLEDESIPTEVGSVVSFRDAAGSDLPGVITAIAEDSVSVDFNHPLAGKPILFKARIMSVIPASVAAVDLKL